MKLIIGLGNPGEKYRQNRHNVGFIFCDFFAKELIKDNNINLTNENIFEQNDKFRAFIFEIKTSKEKYIITKPQTFMNKSGESVKKIKDFYKIPTDAIIVAHDDLDIPLGKFKIQKANGPKMHNGLTSIEQHLGTADYWRIRIGVDNRPLENRMPGEAYVLQDFTEEEKSIIKQVNDHISKRLGNSVLI